MTKVIHRQPDRFFFIFGKGWYCETRDGGHLGPVATKTAIKLELKLFLSKYGQNREQLY